MKVRAGDSKIFQIVRKWKGEKLPAGSFAILGVPDDRGVAISKGRVGAKKGPDAIRKELYKMTLGPKGELEELKLWDLGDVKPQKTQEATYQKLSDLVFKFLEQDVFVIVLGGGHDLSFGSLSGFLRKFHNGGIINIDAHLDCRPPEAKGRYSSGTPFWQLLEKTKLPGKNLLEFGIQPHCNSITHFEYLKERGVQLVHYPGNFEATLRPFASGVEALVASFDMDSVRAADAPGVSAINPLGFSALEALNMVSLLAKEPKLKLFEVMEVNPRFDPDQRTAKLAARLIFELLIGLS